MALKYDEQMFKIVFRALAITDPSNLVIGQTYWSNAWTGPKVLSAVLSDREFDIHQGREPDENDDSKSKWMIFSDGSYRSTFDANIGASYNPWLIFDNEHYSTCCRNLLPVEFIRDKWDDLSDGYDDWNKGWYDDDEWLLSGDDEAISSEEVTS